MTSRFIRTLLAFASLAALCLSIAPSALAMEPFPISHYVWSVPSVAIYNEGYDPQSMTVTELVATNYLTVTVRDSKSGDRIAYRLTYDGQTFDRFDVAGQTNGLHLARSASSTIGIALLPQTTQTGQNVTISVCTGAHKSCARS